MVKIIRRFLLGLALMGLVSGCAKPSEEPVTFLPVVRNAQSANAEALRLLYCSPERISFRDGFLTDANIRGVFQCANYDGSLAEMSGLILNPEFPDFLTHMNAVISSHATKDLGRTLREWLEPQAGGEKSKVDELLPLLSSIIKNPAFQEALPVVHDVLKDGQDIWREVLPSMADLVYTERFPYTFDDLGKLFAKKETEQNEKSEAKKTDYAKRVKLWARFLPTKMDNGKTAASGILELLNEARELKLPNVTLAEYVDQLNVKGALTAIYLESGRHRGELINPKLNADPEKDETEPLTPEQRQRKAYRQLFQGGETAPILQLASIVREFNREHPNFLPSLGKWFSGNGDKIIAGVTEYVAEALGRGAVSRVNLEKYLLKRADDRFHAEPNYKINADQFVHFLKTEFLGEMGSEFDPWLTETLHQVNAEQFGTKNARLFDASNLKEKFLSFYRLPEVAEFGRTIVPAGKTLPIGQAIKRFSNLHRTDKLLITVGDKRANLEMHLVDTWIGAVKDSLGESIVISFGLKLAQTFFTDFTNNFADRKTTLSKWYYQSAYSDPGSTESIAAYIFKELNMLDVWERNRDYLKNEFAVQVFSDADDLRAFRLLVDQVPNIWLYIRSGMMRSGNDLTRVLAERDDGYLIKNYVDIISTTVDTGLLSRAVPIYSQYLSMEAESGLAKEAEPYVDNLEERRYLAKGVQAFARVADALLEPAKRGDYETTTMHKLLVPFTGLVKDGKRPQMERLLVKVSDEILSTSDEKINRFFDDFDKSKTRKPRVETLKATAELLKHEKLPDVVGNVRRFFDDGAVKPALDFFAKKIDDGTLDRVLLFVRRVLGLRGNP